jgi:hypothetical protein
MPSVRMQKATTTPRASVFAKLPFRVVTREEALQAAAKAVIPPSAVCTYIAAPPKSTPPAESPSAQPVPSPEPVLQGEPAPCASTPPPPSIPIAPNPLLSDKSVWRKKKLATPRGRHPIQPESEDFVSFDEDITFKAIGKRTTTLIVGHSFDISE